MKKSLFTLFCLVSLTSIALFNGCKKDEDPLTPQETVPNDVFPLTAGHSFQYSGYFTYQDTDSILSASASFYSSTWTVMSADTPLANVYGSGLATLIASKPNGKANAALIIDRTLAVPPSTYKTTPVAAYYDNTGGSYYYLTNLGLFFRSSVIKESATATGVRNDSLRFINLAFTGKKIGESFTCFEENFVSYSNPQAPTTINLKITGTWVSKQDVTVNGMSFTTYYLLITRVASVGSLTVSSGNTAKIWLAKGIGPVKMHLYGDAEVPGNYRELKSKNF